MREITIAEMQRMVRFYADYKNAEIRADNSEINRELDYGMNKYWAMMLRRLSWLYVSSQDITLTGAASYASNARERTVAIEIVTGSSTRPIHRANPFAAPYKGASEYGLEYTEQIVYHPFAHNIHLHGTLPTAGTMRVRYIPLMPRPSLLADPDDFIYFPSGWEEIPTLWAAIRLLARDHENTDGLMMLYNDAVSRMNEEADTLDMFQSSKVLGGSWERMFHRVSTREIE